VSALLASVLSTALMPSVALAANGPCSDFTLASPTPLHPYPSSDRGTIKFLPAGHAVTGNCQYIFNSTDPAGSGFLWMRVNYIGPGNNHGFGYINTAKLAYGYHGLCYRAGVAYEITTASNMCHAYIQRWG
jgi:hypothetical protein